MPCRPACLKLQYFTSGSEEGRSQDRLGRLPLAGREDVCEFLTVELLPSAKAPDATAFTHATTLLIESVVPENAGHVLAEDPFCAYV